MSSLDNAIAARKRGFPPRCGRRRGDRRETAGGPPPPAPAENTPSVSCPAAAGTRETGRIPDGLDRSSERGAGAPGAGPAAGPDPTCRDPLAARFRVRRTGPRTGPQDRTRCRQGRGFTVRAGTSGRISRFRHAPGRDGRGDRRHSWTRRRHRKATRVTWHRRRQPPPARSGGPAPGPPTPSVRGRMPARSPGA